ncbi:TyeA family type III secretion system gatekeeper subunit [Erwinia sp. HR93]|uniref:TyeA family type III secretion system gatekeeper subunit n=1 Tax=Erwinia sp. HR93 TaxID=3094840 RepID=UPI002ADEC82D|nr:TyeA family type III secretion system gatekeeper subunit [Erwinia sp. HR93]MEA1063794.1 TyeA family type III secretion system gatekeeper subunit [Erwinia sp. HR93]
MSQIDNLGGARYAGMLDAEQERQIQSAPRQIIPAGDPIQAEIQEIRTASLMETMESMSLVMGSRLRQNTARKSGDSGAGQALQDMLMRWVPKVEGQALVELSARFSTLGSQGDPLEQMRQGGVPEGAMALLLASLLGDPRLEQKRRRRLEDALSRLLEDESLAIDVFAWLETGAMMNSASLLPLRQLYQRTRNEDEEQPQGIIEWFEEVREWPDRRLRLKLLIRALALDLRQDADHQPARVVAAINELKRLLLFFSMEEHCASVAFSVDVPAEQMLAAVLMLIEQSWVYPDWVEARMREMGIAGDKVFIYLRRMLELLSLLPALCFQDEEQSVQLMEAFEQLQEQWGEEGGN